MAACLCYLIACALVPVVTFAETGAEERFMEQQLLVSEHVDNHTVGLPIHRISYIIFGAVCSLVLLQKEVKILYQTKGDYSKCAEKLEKVVPTGMMQTTKKTLASIELPYKAWAATMILGTAVYFSLGGTFAHLEVTEALSYLGSMAESFGLVVLFQRVSRHRSVAGVSGVTMQLYAAAYTFRLYQVFPGFVMMEKPSYDFHKFMLSWSIWAMSCVSFIQVLDILRRIFVLYPSTYQKELDKVQAVPVFCALVLLAVFVHPTIVGQRMYSILWSANMYVDCAALLPQVVMMASSGGKIKAPIAHFVAATALSRSIDLICWVDNIRVATAGFSLMPNFNAAIIVLAHVLNLLLVADFVWYYLTARLSGAALSEDLAIPVEEV